MIYIKIFVNGRLFYFMHIDSFGIPYMSEKKKEGRAVLLQDYDKTCEQIKKYYDDNFPNYQVIFDKIKA